MKSYTSEMINNFSKIKKTVVFDGIIVGLFAGFVSVLYRYLLQYLEKICKYIYSFDITPVYLIALIVILSIFGYVVGLLVKWAPLSSGSGIPQVQGEILGLFNMDEKKIIISKFLGGSLAAIGGLSLGREGPSIQLGAASGKVVSKFMRRDTNEEKILISSGASAGLAGAFSAPISGTLFVLEEMHKSFAPFILIPAIIASVMADFISKNMFGLSPVFSFSVKTPLPLFDYHHIILLGIFIGVLGVCFNKSLLISQNIYKKLPIKNQYKPIIAFMFAIVFAFTFPYVLGGGHNVIENIADNGGSIQLLVSIMILNMLFTAISYGSTAQGGIFLPSLVVGGVGGAVYYSIATKFGFLENHNFLFNFIILAMSAMLASVVRSPILSIMLVTEMTGSFEHILSLCIVSVVSYLVAEVLKQKPIYEELLERMLENKAIKSNGIVLKEKVLYEFAPDYNCCIIDKRIKDIDIPDGSLIVAVSRFGKEILPKGDTIIKFGDIITVITDNENLKNVKEFFDRI